MPRHKYMEHALFPVVQNTCMPLSVDCWCLQMNAADTIQLHTLGSCWQCKMSRCNTILCMHECAETYQPSGISFWRNGSKVVIGNSHHNPAACCIGPAGSDSPISGECLIRPVLVPDSLKVTAVSRLSHALLGHSNGCCECCIDAWVGSKLRWDRIAAGRAGLLALSHPLLETRQAEIVLAWCLHQQVT